MSETQEELQCRLLASRTAGGQSPEPLPHYAAPPPRPSLVEQLKARGGIMGLLASLFAVFAKFKFLLFALLKLKFLLGFGSMLVSMWAWGAIYGWKFGVGLVLLIFIHECGHVAAFRLRGIPVTGMVFIPFMGAFVTGKRGGQDAAENAFIGIMGPVFGALAGIVCLLVYSVSPISFWTALAQWSFLINLFNLLPIPTPGRQPPPAALFPQQRRL